MFFETLESRRLCSVTLQPNGTLVFEGASGVDSMSVTSQNQGVTYKAEHRGVAVIENIPGSAIKAVVMRLGAGNDAFGGSDFLNVPFTVYCGPGNDIGIAGSQFRGALIYGEAGNDRVGGGKSNDTLIGGEGNDSLRGGDGDDVLEGGRGRDTMIGDAGNDTFYSRDGERDIVNGGEGIDRLQGDRTLDEIIGVESFFG